MIDTVIRRMRSPRNIRADQAETSRPDVCEVLRGAGDEIVHDDDAMAFREQLINQMGADEARAAGDEDAQTTPSRRLCDVGVSPKSWRTQRS